MSFSSTWKIFSSTSKFPLFYSKGFPPPLYAVMKMHKEKFRLVCFCACSCRATTKINGFIPKITRLYRTKKSLDNSTQYFLMSQNPCFTPFYWVKNPFLPLVIGSKSMFYPLFLGQKSILTPLLLAQ